MTTYNGEKYLREQIDSILNQTYKDIELVICDDGSTDSTREILKEYEAKDKRVRIFFNETNLGFKKNFEKAASLCRGDYIAFSDQDDIWLPFKLERSISLIGENDIYCSNAILVDENNTTTYGSMIDLLDLHYIPKNTNIVLRHLFHQNICQGATMLCKEDFVHNSLPIPEVMH